MFGSKFRQAGSDLSDWPEIDDYNIRNILVPKHTIIEPLEVNGIGAEWVHNYVGDNPPDTPLL
jgi:hypothetical protein